MIRQARDIWNRLNGPTRFALVVVFVAVGIWIVYGVRVWIDNRHTTQTTRTITNINAQVNETLQEAETHGNNANTASVQRQMNDAAIADSRRRQSVQRQRSQQAAQRLKEARQRYEKTLTDNPDPSVLGDDELCARLKRLDIACR